jgi:hypothetical protein
MTYEENPQTPQNGISLILGKRHSQRTATTVVPDQKQSKRAVELHTTSLTYPQILPTRHFYFVVFRMWGAGVINESILSKAVASALGNLR